jgi:hypothetical protein
MRCKKEDVEEKRHKTRTVKICKKMKEQAYMKERGKDKEFDTQAEMSHPRSHIACLDDDLQNFYSADQGSNRYFSPRKNS